MVVGILIYTTCGNNEDLNDVKEQKMTDSINELEGLKNEYDSLTTNYISKSISNMQTAYMGEMTASAKYKDYAKNAELEGYHHIALLYKAISLSESIHANNHKSVLIEADAEVPKVKIEYTINNTKQNLKNDIENEAYEASNSYPEFIKTAEKANNKMAVVSLTYAMKTEKMHNMYCKIALEHLQKGTESTLPSIFYLCPTCGNTFENNAPDRCNFSLTKADKFIKINSYK